MRVLTLVRYQQDSFSGFCAVTYLSFAPPGLKQVLITGGIPPIANGCTADAVYKASSEQVTIQSEKYSKRYRQDAEVVREVAKYFAECEGGRVILPSGGILTPRGFQTLGLSGLGFSASFERSHYVRGQIFKLESAWDPILVPEALKQISYFFLKTFENWLGFDTNPLYALLNEPIYCQGASSERSAYRLIGEDESKFDAVKVAKEGRPVLFTGEVGGTSVILQLMGHVCIKYIYNIY
ncbi:proline iminopeptidase-like [Rhodamnia argentea]|uniref:Proline iminopeptidase-like n=1 Tax=Rhodamnia argentea TaxID=178133 RepID=A0ABM3HXV4_9MYRT|nr:proline iminopeptidase-like [Rhodamnia argentea]